MPKFNGSLYVHSAVFGTGGFSAVPMICFSKSASVLDTALGRAKHTRFGALGIGVYSVSGTFDFPDVKLKVGLTSVFFFFYKLAHN